MWSLSVNPNQCSPEFLFRLLKLPSLFVLYRRFGEGTVRSSIGFHLLRNLPLLIPPKDEQRQILVILAAIDEAIDRTEAFIDATEGLREALLHELLTRGVPGLALGVARGPRPRHRAGGVAGCATGGSARSRDVRYQHAPRR